MNGLEQLEDVVRDLRFVEADLRLRRGHHVGREDHDLYAFVLDALAPLEELCERYGARLIHRTDGYFFLVPTGDRLSRRQLTTGEMLVGQALALLYLDPATRTAPTTGSDEPWDGVHELGRQAESRTRPMRRSMDVLPLRLVPLGRGVLDSLLRRPARSDVLEPLLLLRLLGHACRQRVVGCLYGTGGKRRNGLVR